MTRSLVALWGILLAAILTISVLAQFWISQRERSAQQRVQEILLERLIPYDDAIKRVIDSYSLEMQRQVDACDLRLPMHCVELMRSPLIGSLTVVNRQSQLVYPTDITNASQDRRSLTDEAQQLLQEMADPRPAARQSVSPVAANAPAQQVADYEDLPIFNSRSYSNRQQASAEAAEAFGQQAFPAPSSPLLLPQVQQEAGMQETTDAQSDSATAASPTAAANVDESNASSVDSEYGWITWYHRRGMVLGFWWNQDDERRAIATIPRARWMADIVSALPDTSAPKEPLQKLSRDELQPEELNQLIDVEGNVIYQWGNYPRELWDGVKELNADAIASVSQPLEGWRLRVFASPVLRQKLAGDNVVLPLWLAVGGLSLSLLLGGVLVTTSFNRQMRQAARRVSFVNQVSHELRTPLTNICMYADLLANALELDEPENAANLQRVAVIQNESQRLSRLIGNVLQFARAETHPSALRLRGAVVDDVVREVLTIFEPRLREVGISLSLYLDASEVRQIDADIVEQILVNLVSNVEKYAAQGRKLEISTKALGESVELVVRDFGPGVPARMAEKIFLPFVRLSDRLEDPAGTGIGLTIVRDLARRHGGDCRLEPTTAGAEFHCTFEARLSQHAARGE